MGRDFCSRDFCSRDFWVVPNYFVNADLNVAAEIHQSRIGLLHVMLAVAMTKM